MTRVDNEAILAGRSPAPVRLPPGPQIHRPGALLSPYGGECGGRGYFLLQGLPASAPDPEAQMSGPHGEHHRPLDDHMAAHYLSQYRSHGNGGICPTHGVARCRPWAEAHASLVQEGIPVGDQPNSQVAR